MTMSLIINEERVRCLGFGPAARRQEGEYPWWIFDRRATPPPGQRPATLRAAFRRASGGVAPRSQGALAMLRCPCGSTRALPDTRRKAAHPFPIYEQALWRPEPRHSMSG